MGQRVQFLYAKTEDGVHAWDLPDGFNPALIDVPRYKELLFRAVHEVLQPIGIPENILIDWMFGGAGNVPLPSLLKYPDLTQNTLPLFAAYHIPEIGRNQQECAFRESLPI